MSLEEIAIRAKFLTLITKAQGTIIIGQGNVHTAISLDIKLKSVSQRSQISDTNYKDQTSIQTTVPKPKPKL
jgi:hypothetical protein